MTSACWIRCSLPPQGDSLPVPRFLCVLSPMSDPPRAAGSGQLPPGWFMVLSLPCRVLAGLFWGVGVFGVWGSRTPHRLGSGAFCGACAPCVWCVTPWALSLPAVCLCVPPAGSLDPNWIWGHINLAPIFWECCHPGPPSSAPVLGSWGGSPAWLCLPSWLPLVLRSSP